MKYVSVSQMQAIEREANAKGLSYEIMMENAGRGLAEVILKDDSELEDTGAFGLVGSGNNGGDTLVALTCLAEAGWRVSAAIISSRPEADPLITRLANAGGRIFDFYREPDLERLGMLVESYAILLDGVLGTGTRLPLRGNIANILDTIRKLLMDAESKPLVIAVDCPSGVDCDSGEAASECIPADRTITMAAVKQGLLKFPAYNLLGDLDVVEIGLPDGGDGLETWRSIETFVPDASWVRRVLPPRPLDSHKGTFGTALVVAGSASYTGAALLAGRAAARIGTGLVTLAIAENLHPALAGNFAEATWLLLPQEGGFIAEEASQKVLDHLERATATLVGCGFGLQATTGRFLSRLLDGGKLPPLVIDADGLKLLAQLANWQKRLPEMTVLTPHPGEMAGLTGLSINEIQSDRTKIARKFSQTWGHVVILKGAFTVIAEPGGKEAIIPFASPSLAHAGTGDVLAGLVTGLRAQGVPAFEASIAGAWIHASAGLKAAASLGSTASVLAGDVLHFTIAALADLSN
jgi:hydroxyethylthiazole kinase-like uncharacterized protein yjeF